MRVSPSTRVWAAWVVLAACVIAWPLTALTVFADEPQGILGLSYLSLILTALNIVATADVRDQEES